MSFIVAIFSMTSATSALRSQSVSVKRRSGGMSGRDFMPEVSGMENAEIENEKFKKRKSIFKGIHDGINVKIDNNNYLGEE